jgi:hypothetical protein
VIDIAGEKFILNSLFYKNEGAMVLCAPKNRRHKEAPPPYTSQNKELRIKN